MLYAKVIYTIRNALKLDSNVEFQNFPREDPRILRLMERVGAS